MVVDQLAHLGAHVLAKHRRVLVAVAGPGVDVGQLLGVGAKGSPSGRGSTTSSDARNALSLTANSARSRSSASASTQASVSSRLTRCPAAEQVHHAQVPVAQHRHLVLQALQRAVDVLVGIGGQRLLQVCATP
jgi:hypothetical protein